MRILILTTHLLFKLMCYFLEECTAEVDEYEDDNMQCDNYNMNNYNENNIAIIENCLRIRY